jgi:hypothetical protein
LQISGQAVDEQQNCCMGTVPGLGFASRAICWPT